jgi:hypothetical protein
LKLTVPLTVRIPPMGAAGGMVLREAFAASPINASSVLGPDVGLHESVHRISWGIGDLTHLYFQPFLPDSESSWFAHSRTK